MRPLLALTSTLSSCIYILLVNSSNVLAATYKSPNDCATAHHRSVELFQPSDTRHSSFLERFDQYLDDLSNTEWFKSFSENLYSQVEYSYEILESLLERDTNLPFPAVGLAAMYIVVTNNEFQCYPLPGGGGRRSLIRAMINVKDMTSTSWPGEPSTFSNSEDRQEKTQGTDFDLRKEFQYIDTMGVRVFAGVVEGYLDQLEQILAYARYVYTEREVEGLKGVYEWWAFAGYVLGRLPRLVFSAEGKLREGGGGYDGEGMRDWLDLDVPGWKAREGAGTSVRWLFREGSREAS